MKITKQELIEMNVLTDVLNRFIAQTNNTEEPVEVTSLIGGKNTIPDLIWLAGKKLSEEKIVRFACDCALINIQLIKPYTDEYDDIVDFLNNHTAVDADYYAVDADYYARAAGHADYYAARAAAAGLAAGLAAGHAPSHVAAANAASHARAAAGNCEDKINELLVELFTGEE